MTTTEKFNVNFDFGHLLVNDAQPFITESITEAEIKERGVQNLQVFFRELFKLCTSQVGEDNENKDFDKPKNTVKLPEAILKLPRSKPIPKPKPLTKWEKYRLEKGLPPRKKRSRMLWSELAQDWVPRWGKGSAKNIEEKADWALEERPGEEDKNPFTLRKQQKDLNKLKEKKKELKNFQNGEKEIKKKQDVKEKRGLKKNNSNKNSLEEKTEVKKDKKNFKKEKSDRLESDKKGLSKTLETVQKSTASMGKFDKKIKNEKELNPLKKNKISKEILLNRKTERDRDRKILENIIGVKKTKKI